MCQQTVQQIEQHIAQLGGADFSLMEDARKRYEDSRRSRNAETVVANYQPRLVMLANQTENQMLQLQQLQAKYKQCELGLGLAQMQG